jgi:hypothetical protein
MAVELGLSHYGKDVQNRVLGRIFRPKWLEAWSRLHNEELHNLYSSPNIIRVVKSRRMLWVGYVARMGEMRNAYKVLSKNLKGGDHEVDLRVDGRIILE